MDISARIMLKCRGPRVGCNVACRFHHEKGLALRTKRPRWREDDRSSTQRPHSLRMNEVWGLDLVHDQLNNGARKRMLARLARPKSAIDHAANMSWLC